MTEKLLHYIWQSGYFNQSHLTTCDGENIRIISKGTLNKNQGPDFLSAMVSIGDTVFAGSVELHLKTSDWERHNHSADENYRNVILHVVYEHDHCGDVNIPVLELQPHIPSLLVSRYETLMNTPESIACGNNIAQVQTLTWIAWKERVLVERLVRKSEHIYTLLQETNGHWEEVFWQLLARNFGIKVNADSFELLAHSLPLKILVKHKHSIHQVEALLFGQANLLNDSFNEDYPKLLKREYAFLKKKYGLTPAFAAVHFLRMRPANFPTVRLAQLAMVIHTSSHLFSKILEEDSILAIQKCLEVTANDYWHYHYRFEELCAFHPKKTGDMIINNIIINTIIPILFAYGLYHKDETVKGKALRWLNELPSESNRINSMFVNLGMRATSAFDSQAMVELKNEYCDRKRCLECAVGAALLKPIQNH
jgi:hypothetical protein